MTRVQLRPCLEPGCPQLVSSGRCPEHAAAVDRAAHDRPWRSVYDNPRWRALRRQVRREQPWCAVDGCRNMTAEVDHIVAMQDGGDPFDRDNVQGLCRRHHSEKTADELRARRAAGAP